MCDYIRLFKRLLKSHLSAMERCRYDFIACTSTPNFAHTICKISEVLLLSISKMKDVFEDIYVGGKHCHLIHYTVQHKLRHRKAMDQIVFPQAVQIFCSNSLLGTS